MSFKPILFNTEMVQALLAGRKTVTRRVIKPQPDEGHEFFGINCMDSAEFVRGNHCCEVDLPFVPGDILWVRETCDNVPVTRNGQIKLGGVWYYKADGDLRPRCWRGNWTPSIHMPKSAARIFLQVTNVWVERLQDITITDCKREGVVLPPPRGDEYDYELDPDCRYLFEFQNLWDELQNLWKNTLQCSEVDQYGWAANPWVWVIEFKQITKQEAENAGWISERTD